MLFWWMRCRFVYVWLVRLLWDRFFTLRIHLTLRPRRLRSSLSCAPSPSLCQLAMGSPAIRIHECSHFPDFEAEIRRRERRGEHLCDSKKVGKHCFPGRCIVFWESILGLSCKYAKAYLSYKMLTVFEFWLFGCPYEYDDGLSQPENMNETFTFRLMVMRQSRYVEDGNFFTHHAQCTKGQSIFRYATGKREWRQNIRVFTASFSRTISGG